MDSIIQIRYSSPENFRQQNLLSIKNQKITEAIETDSTISNFMDQQYIESNIKGKNFQPGAQKGYRRFKNGGGG